MMLLRNGILGYGVGCRSLGSLGVSGRGGVGGIGVHDRSSGRMGELGSLHRQAGQRRGILTTSRAHGPTTVRLLLPSSPPPLSLNPS